MREAVMTTLRSHTFVGITGIGDLNAVPEIPNRKHRETFSVKNIYIYMRTLRRERRDEILSISIIARVARDASGQRTEMADGIQLSAIIDGINGGIMVFGGNKKNRTQFLASRNCH